MKRLAISLLALGACSTTPPPPPLGDVDLTNAGLMLAIEICHRNIIDSVPIAQAVGEAARGRKHEPSTIYSVVTGISPPSWKLDGDVLVGANDRGGCEIYIASGNGPEARKLAVSTHLGMSSRRWASMQIIAAPWREDLCFRVARAIEPYCLKPLPICTNAWLRRNLVALPCPFHTVCPV